MLRGTPGRGLEAESYAPRPGPECQACEGKGAIGAKTSREVCVAQKGQVRSSGRSDKVGTGQSTIAVSDGRAVRQGRLGF